MFEVCVVSGPNTDRKQLQAIVSTRYERASLVQACTRLLAKPAASKGNKTVQPNS